MIAKGGNGTLSQIHQFKSTYYSLQGVCPGLSLRHRFIWMQNESWVVLILTVSWISNEFCP